MSSRIRNCFNVEVDFVLRDARLRQGSPMLPIIYLVLFAESFQQRREITLWDGPAHVVAWVALTARCSKKVAKECLAELQRQKLIELQGGTLTVFGLEALHPNVNHWYSTVANPKGVNKYRKGASSQEPSEKVVPRFSHPSSADTNLQHRDSDPDSDSDPDPDPDPDSDSDPDSDQKDPLILDRPLNPVPAVGSATPRPEERVCSDGGQVKKGRQEVKPAEVKEYIRRLAATYSANGDKDPAKAAQSSRQERRAILAERFGFLYAPRLLSCAAAGQDQLLAAVLFALTDTRAKDPEGALYQYAVKTPSSLPDIEMHHHRAKQMAFGG